MSKALSPIDELSNLLRPPGGGLYLVSTGADAQRELQRRLLGADTDAEVMTKWRAQLESIREAKAVVLAVPSDVGAGFRRGANLGPQAMRTALLDEVPDWPERARAAGVVDIGDVRVVPQLLHDEMLSDAQKVRSQNALYGELPADVRSGLPVSPLSIAERALDLVFSLAPNVKPIVLGGDHSTAWPVAAALGRARRDRWGVVQPDAHTDLLSERLGVPYCFATWSYHANELLGRGGRMIQVGTRASRHDRGHWESSLDVRQVWADECLRDPAAALDRIVACAREAKLDSVYFSNDIDGTDSRWADATGTPEPGGLEPDFVVELIRRLGREVGLCAGDVMEVAPPLRDKPDSTERTVALAVRYLRETMNAALGSTDL
ncbi:MAG: arginase family protein [Myxococcales bacterium]|nr:arginase family protein [Myxococcales bacterium]